MTIFKNYFKIVKKSLPIIIMYTMIFVSITAISVSANENTNMEFTASKPDIAIINNDSETVFLQNFEKYISKNAQIKDVQNDETSLKDALFFGELDYILIIPENFTQDFMDGKSPKIETMKVPESYNSNYCEMMLNKYLNTASIYINAGISENELDEYINKDLEKTANVEIKQNAESGIGKIKYFFNFSNYTILATSIFVIGSVMVAFNEKNIKRRNIISSTSYTKINKQLFLGNIVLTLLIWLTYAILSFVLGGKTILCKQGMLFLLNSLVFCMPVLSLGFLIGNIVKNKEAQNGIVNVISLGSSFLCGAFVPQEFLGEAVLNFAKILPSYWFIKNNENIAILSPTGSVQEIVINMLVMCGFAVAIFAINSVIYRIRLKEK